MPKKPHSPPTPADHDAAEDDARAMLLAGGLTPKGDSPLAQLVLDLPDLPREAYTIPEFCQIMRISKSTYYRLEEAGEAPVVITLLGDAQLKRITREAFAEWRRSRPEMLARVAQIEAQEREAKATGVAAPMHPRVMPKKKKGPAFNPDAPRKLFEPSPPKRRSPPPKLNGSAKGNSDD